MMSIEEERVEKNNIPYRERRERGKRRRHEKRARNSCSSYCWWLGRIVLQ